MAVLDTMTIDGTVYNIQDSASRTANRVMVSDANGILAASDINPNDLALSDDIPGITASTTDLTAGTSPLSTGDIYLVYEA